MKTVRLYRPVGLKELELIAASGWKKFPPRLQWQPIFYPVLNEAYAAQIAFEWNTKDEFSGYCGIVMAFDISETCYSKYAVQNVGGEIHNELWVPSGELDDFNNSIAEEIAVIKVYLGERFELPQNKTLAEILIKYKVD